MPNPDTFPFSGVTLTVRDGTELTFDAEDLNGSLQYSSTSGVSVGFVCARNTSSVHICMSTSFSWHPPPIPALSIVLLNSLATPRVHDLQALVKQLTALQTRVHQPPTDTTLCVTTGSQEALTRAFAMLLDPTDTLLVEEPTYSGALAYLKPMGCQLVGIPTDGEGLIPSALAAALDTWETGAHAGTPKPRVLYTIPTGANPSGGTMGLDRRREVYAVARDHGLIVLEDDPYYYLYLGEERPPSLLSLDVDGRVLRFDSFSKVLSSGMRLGFATGPPALISQLELHTQAVNLHPCGLSQVAAAKLLEHWGPDGFDAHVKSICGLYRRQRDAFLASAERHLAGLAEWHAPEAGMFVWLKLLGVEDSLELIKTDAVAEKVLLVPGAAFSVGGPSGYVRAAYSTASPDDMEEAMVRLARLLRRNALK